MGGQQTKPSNKSMVDRLVEHYSYIHTPSVEGVFRAVDRAMYFDFEEGEPIDPYDDDPWRRGNLHLSAPCIYAKVVEALDLRPGLSFLNLGSGTGYLNTIIGLLVGPHGINHGIEFHSDVVDYAYKRLQQFKQKSYALDKYDFSEPIFVKGNCLNINPESRYDRIYLGAACLPDLENFMKKLIKSNGGILVMPYENHLMRYIRISETEWSSEKLMDVNFTLMIRPDSNGAIINMPLAQAKSLKELCRITIRQQLREKIDFMNPSLLHSDNINSRRMRKAKAERQLLLREERRLKSLQMAQNFDTSNREKNQCHPNSRCICRRRNQREVKEETTPNIDVSGDGSNSTLSSRPKETLQSKPGTSSGCHRVMTRSVSRRLESLEGTEPGIKLGPDNMPSNANQTTNNADLSNAQSSDSDSDNEDKYGSATQVDDCARTRPFVCSVRNRPSNFSRFSSRPLTSTENPVNNHPLNWSLQSRPDLVDDFSSSSPESSIVDEANVPNIEEYDYIGHQMVLNWPGWLFNNEDLDMVAPSSSSSSSSSSGSSDSILTDIILDTDSSNESDWDILDGLYDNRSDDDLESSNSSNIREPPRLAEREESGDDEQEEGTVSRVIIYHSPTQPKPSTSRENQSQSESESAENSKYLDQEPVARRLRSKRSDAATDSASPANNVAVDRPIPDCNREGTHRERHHRQEYCSRQHHCRTHSCHQHRHHHHHHHHHHHRHHKHERHCFGPSQSSGSMSSNNHTNTDSTHSSARLSSTESPTVANTLGQEMFSGRVLITTGLGTTLSLATRHYFPNNSPSSSFRLFERRSLSSIGSNRSHHRHLQQSVPERKRKQHPCPECSETSNTSSPNRRGNNTGLRRRRTRCCACHQAQPKCQRRQSEETSTNILPTAGTSSSTNTPQPSKVPISSTSGSIRNSDCPYIHISGAQSDDNVNTGINVNSSASTSGPSSSSRLQTTGASGINFRLRELAGRAQSLLDCEELPVSARLERCQRENARNYRERRQLMELKALKRGDRESRRKKRKKRGENECERYHNHISGYIRQLPLPRVLHGFLNYDRNF